MSNSYYAGFTHSRTQYGTQYVPVAPQVPYSTPTTAYSNQTSVNYDQSAYSVNAEYNYSNRNQNTAYPSTSGHYADQSSSGEVYGYSQHGSHGYTDTYTSVVSDYAANAIYSQQGNSSVDQSSVIPVYSNTKNSNNWSAYKQQKGVGGGSKNFKNKGFQKPQQPQQLHYCEICKISCAGPQAYKEHLEGQRHKKKEAANNTSSKSKPSVTGITIRCELCDITCTGNDAYKAHVIGQKHQRVLNLHTKLGKPIPPQEPVMVNTKGQPVAKVGGTAAASKIKVMGTPTVNFVGGGRLQMSATGLVTELMSEAVPAVAPPAPELPSDLQPPVAQSTEVVMEPVAPTPTPIVKPNNIAPIGHDYIEEITEPGKPLTFQCKLCDCKFGDPAAKEMHLKGRRHRLNFKKKVDPALVVDMKQNAKQRKGHERKERQNIKPRPYVNDWYNTPYNDSFDNGYYPPPMFNNPGPMGPAPMFDSGYCPPLGPPMAPAPMYDRPQKLPSWDDAHVFQKHSEICPKEYEIDEVQHVVTITERALKLVSDVLAAEDTAKRYDAVIQKELAEITSLGKPNPDDSTTMEADTEKPAEQTDDSKPPERILKGLMRVGPLAKNLLLAGDPEVELVVICAEKPTRNLLDRVSENLPLQIQVVSPLETYKVVQLPQDAAILVSSTTEPKIQVTISLTSPVVRESIIDGTPIEVVKEPKQMLDRQKCLDALAELRHAKWFQARVANLFPCPLVIRVFRDLFKRIPIWSSLSLWSMELLCERVISSAGEPLSPGEAMRHVFECIASGILLPGGLGLNDPCEKDPVDALANLSKQEREDITASAQHALRLMAFRQVYKILGLEPLYIKGKKRRSDQPDDSNLADKKQRTSETDWSEDANVTSIEGGIQQFSEETPSTTSNTVDQ